MVAVCVTTGHGVRSRGAVAVLEWRQSDGVAVLKRRQYRWWMPAAFQYGLTVPVCTGFPLQSEGFLKDLLWSGHVERLLSNSQAAVVASMFVVVLFSYD